jgi:uncharacterized membrane protein YbhN (UPF0104 family)
MMKKTFHRYLGPLISVILFTAAVWLLLVIVYIYILFTIIKKALFKVRGYELKLPPIRLLFPQLTIAAMDWAIAGSVLYVLLARIKGFSYFGFLGLYLLARLIGLVSQVPGGCWCQ